MDVASGILGENTLDTVALLPSSCSGLPSWIVLASDSSDPSWDSVSYVDSPSLSAAPWSAGLGGSGDSVLGIVAQWDFTMASN